MVNFKDGCHMATPIKMYLPRIYLDTNILISAILESEDKWKQSHIGQYKHKKKQIESSKEIYYGWEHRADHLKTSTFAIGEFIGRGNIQFGKSFQQMLDIVDREILTRCKVLKVENLSYDAKLIPKRMQKEIHLVEIIGKAQVGTEFRYMLTLNMGIGKMLSGGPEVAGVNYDNLVMQEIKSYRAPGFEIMLYQKASELANKYGLGLADAFHLFYAQGQVEYLITNDRGFLNRWKKDPKVEKETGVKAMSSTDLVELCKRRRYKL